MSGSGNGADVAAVYQLLSQVAQTVAEHSRRFDRLESEFNVLESGMEDGFATLRQTVTQYHASVMGHGILISELDHRVRRIEEHLHLPPIT